MVWIGKKILSKDKLNVTKNFVWGNETFNLLSIKFSVDLDSMVSMNYSPIIEKRRETLNSWNKWLLTPLGKITI